MLTESFISATLISEKTKTKLNKDASIHHYDFQPLQALKGSFKKSSARQNCLAISASHIFAAQSDKSVIHVYSRDRGSQEAVVPFPDRIRSIALAADADGAGVLVLGTEGGGVILWELCTGRQVSTPPSHLHPTTCLAVDPTSNFVLSGSPDSNVHVWSIPSLLAFSASYNNDPNHPHQSRPVQSLSNHRAAINAIGIGHSASKSNIAVSASQDSTCIVWDYIEGTLLHTFLLPSVPLCLALDPADRGFCAGYSDGSIQLVDFYKNPSFTHALHDPALQSMPTQPLASDRWPQPNGPPSAAFTMEYSYDGTVLLSGHENGTIQKWDTASGQYGSQTIDLGAPVTNLKILPPTGFPITETPLLKTHGVTKPRYESTMNGPSSTSHLSIPMDYTFTAQLLSPISTSPPTSFDRALSSPLFTPSLINASLASFNDSPSSTSTPPPNIPTRPDPQETDLETQNKLLFTQLETALQNQRTAIKQVLQLERDRYERTQQDERKASRKRKRRLWRMETEQQRREAVMKNGMAEVKDDVRMVGSLRGGVVSLYDNIQDVKAAAVQDEEAFHDEANPTDDQIAEEEEIATPEAEAETEAHNAKPPTPHKPQPQPATPTETQTWEEDLSSTTDDFSDSD